MVGVKSSRRQKTDNSSTAVISVHSSVKKLKTDAFCSLLDSSTHVPSASIKSTTAPREVYTAFIETFSKKIFNSLVPEDKTIGRVNNMVLGKKVSATYKRFHCSTVLLSFLHTYPL